MPENLSPTPRWRAVAKVIVMGRNPRRTLARIAILGALGALTYVVFGYALLPVRVVGKSMEPTYDNGAANFSNRLIYLFREPRRGDVVTVRYAGVHTMLLKRIVGLPGETVAFRDGQLLINGSPTPEPYLADTGDWTMPPQRLSSTQYFVVGDNRSIPWRQQTLGAAERFRIVGKVLL